MPNGESGTHGAPHSRESQIAPAFAKLFENGKVPSLDGKDAIMRLLEHRICRILPKVQKYSVWRFDVFEREQDVDVPCHTISLWLRMVGI